MSLTFELTGIENYKETGYDKDGNLRPETKSLIFATMAVGIGSITKENAAEFYARLHIFEQVHGTYMNVGAENVFLSTNDVRKHIGLATNVSDETRSQWTRRMFVNKRSVTEDYARFYRAALTELVSN